MHSSTRQDVTLASIVRDLMKEHELDMGTLAARCGVTYQTIKNVVDGRSVNRRFISELIRQFDMEDDPEQLRRIILAFLLAQFEDEGERLLRTAGLLPKPKSK